MAISMGAKVPKKGGGMNDMMAMLALIKDPEAFEGRMSELSEKTARLEELLGARATAESAAKDRAEADVALSEAKDALYLAKASAAAMGEKAKADAEVLKASGSQHAKDAQAARNEAERLATFSREDHHVRERDLSKREAEVSVRESKSREKQDANEAREKQLSNVAKGIAALVLNADIAL